MQPKKRILFFPFDLLSHYLRCIVLANEHYDREAYEILFLSSHSYNDHVSRHGYQTFSCAQFDAERVMQCAEKFDFSWLNEPDIERVLLSQVKVIQSLAPVMVIGDVAPSLKMAAELTGVEYIVLMNGYMSAYYACTRKLSRTHGAYKFSKMIPEKYFDQITSVAERISFVTVHKPFRMLRKKYGLKKVTNYISEMEGDKNLLCDLPELFPQKNLPDHYRIVRPLIYKPIQKEEDWLSNIQRTRPVICICMGSTGNWQRLEFLNDPYFSKYTIITAGDQKKIFSAPHIISRSFVNLEEVLKICDLMICHGGNGTIYYGLMNGIYMLCLTSHFEQEWNVHALEYIGFGESANDFSYEDWKNKIEESLIIKLQPFF
jgi:UDP:flavonoid glycosyltransferase YjiC (YdhE family)